MPLLSVDLESDVPVYRQLADGLCELIARGELATGTELPSVRNLGRQVGVNLNTVAKAYRELAAQGLVELRQGAAARVIAPGEGARRTSRQSPMEDMESPLGRKLRALISQWVLAGMNRARIESVVNAMLDDFFDKDTRVEVK